MRRLQPLSTEVEDLGSLAPMKLDQPGTSRVGDFTYNLPISFRVSKTSQVQGSDASDQGALDGRSSRES
jgi:hypothetical protein